jgi:hypothetical protein
MNPFEPDVLTLSWVVLLSAIGLMSIKLWSWHDTYKDWKAVLAKTPDPESAIYKQAKGFLTLSHARVADGVLWLALSTLTFIHRHTTPPTLGVWPPWTGRAILLTLIAAEAVKLLIDRYTRKVVFEANK